MDSKKIEDFWNWFSSHEQQLRRDPRSLISVLETHLFSIERLDWEIGPADGSRVFLSLSPISQDPTHVSRCRRILDAAPSLPHWQFSMYKPRRTWKMRFSLEAESGSRMVNGEQWEMVFEYHDDKTIDLIFRPDASIIDLPVSELRHAARIIVDGELGELQRRQAVHDIQIVMRWKPEHRSKVQQLRVGLLSSLLAAHLEAERGGPDQG
jgi:hypothetical protein